MPASLPPGLPIVPNGPERPDDGGNGAGDDHAPFPMSETDFEAAVSDALDQIPPELSSDIFDRGVALCGGSVLLRNMDRRLRQETSLPVKIVDQPLSAVVVGAGKMLEDRKLLKRLAA